MSQSQNGISIRFFKPKLKPKKFDWIASLVLLLLLAADVVVVLVAARCRHCHSSLTSQSQRLPRTLPDTIFIELRNSVPIFIVPRFKASVLMRSLSYPTETVLTNKITGNWIYIVLSCKDGPRKPSLGQRPLVVRVPAPARLINRTAEGRGALASNVLFVLININS